MESRIGRTLRNRPQLGSVLCLASAVGYTGANICLRRLTDFDIDPAWVICLKETVAVVTVGPWLIWQAARGYRPTCDPRALAVLCVAALAVQLVANVGAQWSLGVVGLVVNMPVLFGALLVVSAIIGTVMFHEKLAWRSGVAITAVIMAVVLLSIGAAQRQVPAALPGGWFLTSVAIVAAATAGAIYGMMGAILRYAARAYVPIPVTVVVVTGTGTLALGTLCLFRLGPTVMLATQRHELLWVVAAGLCNVVAFALITKGLQLTTLAHANILNASQVALAALAGVVLFHESNNAWLVGGVLLTIVGIVLVPPRH